MKPIGIMSDLHLHGWSAFSKPIESDLVRPGELINSRLDGLLREVQRCGLEVRAAGGDTVFITGDLFHVRGSVAPSVLNPTLDTFRYLADLGIRFFIIPGNHDLEGKHSSRVGSAVTALESIEGVTVIHEPTWIPEYAVAMIPWFEDVQQLKQVAADLIAENAGSAPEGVTTSLMIHAPVDGVILGLPDHGLSPAELGRLGYGRVYSGHYHAHKVFPHADIPDAVISVGAIAHHTWNDVGTQAGFLLVDDSGVSLRASHLPAFVDIDGAMDPLEADLRAKGNYVRLKTDKATAKQVEELREWMTNAGAAGVVIQHIKQPTSGREPGASVNAGASLEVSVGEYIAKQGLEDAAEVTRLALECLAEAGAAC